MTSGGDPGAGGTDTPDGHTGVRRRLRDAGLRATQPRVRILEWLEATPGHHAADTLVERTGLPKATVYHVLGRLRSEGLVVVADAGPGRTLYESAVDAGHHHFVCRRCDRVIDVPTGWVPAPVVGAVAGATVDEVDVILRGRCPDCVDRSSVN